MKSPIILLGYMGCGKTKVGKKLSKIIGAKFYDLDEQIELFFSMPIKNIFKNYGEIRFRELENEVLLKILNKNEFFVLSLGGGAPCYFNNMSLINKRTNYTFFINMDSRVLANRLFTRKSRRPLISEIENEAEMLSFINKHLFERSIYYDKASFTLNPKRKDVKKICESITKILKENSF